MVQEKVKTQVKQVNELKQKLQDQASQQWSKASDELQRVLNELGVENAGEQSLREIVSDIREKNPSFRQLMLKLDAATYDARKRLSWNANMTTAYIRNKAEESYTNELRPLVSNYRKQAEERLQSLATQARKLRHRFAGETEQAEKQDA